MGGLGKGLLGMNFLLRALSTAAVPIMVTAILTAPPGHANDSDPPGPVDPDPIAVTYEGDVEVVEETYTPDFETKVSEEVFDAETEGQLMGTSAPPIDGDAAARNGSGTGGTSSKLGCRKVTVKNERETTLGRTAYWYDTWTKWCWNRATDAVREVDYGWGIRDVDPLYEWKGEVTKELGYYDHGVNDENPRSAFKHWRQGHFQNCPLSACLGNSYPTNLLRSYYNGKWVWETSG